MQRDQVCWSLQPGHRPLLLASVSQAAANAKGGGKLELPNPAALGAEALRRLGGRPKSASSSAPGPKDRSPRARRLHAPDLGAAGTQLQHAAAVAGGVLLAAITQAAQHLVSVRPGARRGSSQNSAPFYQSFRLPWDRATRSGSRRATSEAAALARALAARGHEYERALDVRAAVQCFEEACKLVPDSVPYLSMAAKCWSDLTFYYDVRSDRERQLVNLKAIEYAEKCIEAAPESVFGHVALCISKGRLALFTDNKTKVRLAKEAQLCAYQAIACDPESDVAHHLMGRWHYEMAQINVVLRTLVRIMYGTALAPGTRRDALDSFCRAAELAPQRLIHRVEAGRVHLELGQVAEGVEQLQAALELDVEDINSALLKKDAERMLANCKSRPKAAVPKTEAPVAEAPKTEVPVATPQAAASA